MGKADADGPGLPDLPPEWGRVVIPDDLAALADEAEQVRRELRRAAADRRRWRPPAGPVLVLIVAVLTTIAGLAAVTWPRASRTGPARRKRSWPDANCPRSTWSTAGSHRCRYADCCRSWCCWWTVAPARSR